MKFKMKHLLRMSMHALPKSLKYFILRQSVRLPEGLPEGVIFKMAETREELESAFSLLHDSYVEVGLMKKDPSGLRVTPYHALPSTVTIIAKDREEVVATLAIVRDNPLGLPSDCYVDLSKLRSGGQRVAEISALAIKPQYRGRLLFYLLKHMYEWCVEYLGIDHLIATLTTDSKSHELYEAILFFKPIEVRVESNYAFSNFRPVIAEHLDLGLAYSLFEKHYGKKEDNKNLFNFFTKMRTEELIYPERMYYQVDYPVMDLALFEYFFIQKTEVYANFSPDYAAKLSSLISSYVPENKFKIHKGQSNITALEHRKIRQRFSLSLKGTLNQKKSILKVKILDISSDGVKLSTTTSFESEGTLEAKIAVGKNTIVTLKKMWSSEDGLIAGFKIIESDANWQEMVNHFRAINEMKNSVTKRKAA